MNSSIRPQDAFALYLIFRDPGKGGDSLTELVNFLGKCLGVSSDAGKGRGGHSGGTLWITPQGGTQIQLFTYTTKSYTQEKVTEALGALGGVAAALPDENLRRVVNFALTNPAPAVDAGSFIAKTV